jgi:hypothetical protein
MNIHTAYDLAKIPPGLARKQFSIEIERTVRELNGQVCKQSDEARADKQQIFSTHIAIGQVSFPEGSDTGLPCSVCRAVSG